ncbi:hypothetical protein NPIL_332811 [Nephila pilipes]|uniref:Uncharacterized protein n=1 Tax=Nephila pilipes TaxID=299642 RepID=A0A8X6Q8S1_NEPPI|nr:hypothetical protein NPIL_332811 [Nephila pilipes]
MRHLQRSVVFRTFGLRTDKNEETRKASFRLGVFERLGMCLLFKVGSLARKGAWVLHSSLCNLGSFDSVFLAAYFDRCWLAPFKSRSLFMQQESIFSWLLDVEYPKYLSITFLKVHFI